MKKKFYPRKRTPQTLAEMTFNVIGAGRYKKRGKALKSAFYMSGYGASYNTVRKVTGISKRRLKKVNPWKQSISRVGKFRHQRYSAKMNPIMTVKIGNKVLSEDMQAMKIENTIQEDLHQKIRKMHDKLISDAMGVAFTNQNLPVPSTADLVAMKQSLGSLGTVTCTVPKFRTQGIYEDRFEFRPPTYEVVLSKEAIKLAGANVC